MPKPMHAQLAAVISTMNMRKAATPAKAAAVDSVISAITNVNEFLARTDIKLQLTQQNVNVNDITSAVSDFVNNGDVNAFEGAINQITLNQKTAIGQSAFTTINLLKTLLSTLVGAVVGFFAGACIGAASGPGAAVTAIAGAAKGASIGAGVGTLSGGVLGYFGGSHFFPKTKAADTWQNRTLDQDDNIQQLETAVASLRS